MQQAIENTTRISLKRPVNTRLFRAAALILFISGVMVFLVRGVGHGLIKSGPNDFWPSFAIPRAWILGIDPYSLPNIISIWFNAGTGMDRHASWIAPVLPSAVPIFAPVSILPWRLSNAVLILGSAALFIFMLWRLRPQNTDADSTLLFLGLCLWLDPVRIGLAISNITPLMVALLGLSFHLLKTGRSSASAILLGIVASCKPQLAIAMLILCASLQYWKVILTAIAVPLLSFMVFFSRLQFSEIPWWQSFVERSRSFAATGGPNDYSLLNPERYQLLNLQVPFGSVLNDSFVVNAISISVFLALAIVWVKTTRSHKELTLLDFATGNLLLLLPLYHRTYDASLVVFALAWVFETHLKNIRWVIAASMLLFLQPIPTILIVFTSSPSRIPASLSSNPLFKLLVLSHETWILMLISILLILAIRIQNKEAVSGGNLAVPSRSGSVVL